MGGVLLLRSDLEFFISTVGKSKIMTALTSPDAKMSRAIENTFLDLLGIITPDKLSISEYFGKIEENTVYRVTELFGIRMIYFLLPGDFPERLLIIGPYAGEQYSKEQIPEILEKYRIDPSYHRIYRDYLTSLPVIGDDSYFFVLLSSFAERIWGQGGYSTVVTDRTDRARDSLFIESSKLLDAGGIIARMKLMEERYKFENELISAVEEGRYGKVEAFMAGFKEINFEKRIADPLRNIMNYCIITNTLFRKAAERGGVHPIDIDKLSSSYAVKIEKCGSEGECIELLKEMLKGYCRLVNKHKGAHLSPIVQKAVSIIDADISRELSLSMLADATSVSPGYLCAIFKRDVGKTVTEYITERRMKHAESLLASTHLQIQTVALYTGVMDVQYFSKLFKRYSGLTPKEYRDRNKRI